MAGQPDPPRSPEAKDRKGTPARRPGQPGSVDDKAGRTQPDKSPTPNGDEPGGHRDPRRG